MTTARGRITPLYGAIAGALVISIGLVWLASGDAVTLAAFVAGVTIFLLAGGAVVRLRPASKAEDFASPDWSVTVAAIERGGEAVAVVDRANRLVCANTAYSAWFGANSAPPNLPLDRAGLEALARVAREAWREGSGAADRLEGGDDAGAWSERAERAGRAEDYLVWRFAGLAEEDFVED